MAAPQHMRVTQLRPACGRSDATRPSWALRKRRRVVWLCRGAGTEAALRWGSRRVLCCAVEEEQLKSRLGVGPHHPHAEHV